MLRMKSAPRLALLLWCLSWPLNAGASPDTPADDQATSSPTATRDAGASSSSASLREAMLAAEDARAQTDAELATLRQGLTNRDVKLRQQAVRAMGRLERPELIAALTRSLGDDSVAVRMEAANAVGQLARGPKGVADAKSRLLARAKIEQDPQAWGAVAATLGRLDYTTAADVDQVEAAIARVLPTALATAIQIDALLGASEGLEALARLSGKISRLKDETVNGLRAAAALEGRAQDADKLARIRRFATAALTAAGAVTRPMLDAGIADADEEVRRLTMVAARASTDGGGQAIVRGLADVSPRVRYEALQTLARALQKATTTCDGFVNKLQDPSAHVVLLAIDLLGSGCQAGSATTWALQTLAQEPSTAPGAWHRASHALVSLAKVAPEQARALLPRHLAHPTWQVRMYAARAAGALAAVAELQTLARDAHDNVREAALGELLAHKRPEAMPLAIEAVARPDYQLVRTAARALATAADKEPAIAALRRALQRVTAEQRQTSRDARRAIAEALKALGVPEEVADIAPPSPTATVGAENHSLEHSRLRFTMNDGPGDGAGGALRRGSFELRLLPEEAATTARHIAALAKQGYYNGLTFHRVAPNFVIQGGSPGANEYAGQGPFMRDEVGLLSHRRGTVGISTRGRDTGDAQLFINLVDSPRLDHTYTVFAEVVSGMDVVDGILEGDVISRVDVVSPPS